MSNCWEERAAAALADVGDGMDFVDALNSHGVSAEQYLRARDAILRGTDNQSQLDLVIAFEPARQRDLENIWERMWTGHDFDV